MTTVPYRSGGREDIDDEGFQEPLMVRNMACCAKEIWDLRGSIEIVEQVANYLLKDDAILSEVDPAGMWQMSVRVQWDRVMERLNNARDWCYMPELPEDRQFLAEEGREGEGHPSFYTLEQIAESNKNLKWQLGHLDNPNNALNKAIKRGNC